MCPHIAVLEKLYLVGSSRLEGNWEYLLNANFHLSYSFSSIEKEVWSRFCSPSEIILVLEKRGWLISI